MNVKMYTITKMRVVDFLQIKGVIQYIQIYMEKYVQKSYLQKEICVIKWKHEM